MSDQGEADNSNARDTQVLRQTDKLTFKHPKLLMEQKRWHIFANMLRAHTKNVCLLIRKFILFPFVIYWKTFAMKPFHSCPGSNSVSWWLALAPWQGGSWAAQPLIGHQEYGLASHWLTSAGLCPQFTARHMTPEWSEVCTQNTLLIMLRQHLWGTVLCPGSW